MKLDPDIHIDMHSVLSLKPGVTSNQAMAFGTFGIDVCAWEPNGNYLCL